MLSDRQHVVVDAGRSGAAYRLDGTVQFVLEVWFEKEHVRGEIRLSIPAGWSATMYELVEELQEHVLAEGLILLGVRVQDGSSRADHDMSGGPGTLEVVLRTLGGGRTLAEAGGALERLSRRLPFTAI